MTNKNLIRGSSTMLILNLINTKDMYGYEMIEELEKRSNNVFSLKAGTLYPILHNLELEGSIESYEKQSDNGRIRKYYSITKDGRALLKKEKKDWQNYILAIKNLMGGMDFEL